MPPALAGAVQQWARKGWRIDAVADGIARISRPVFWLPVWAHLLLLPLTCGAWAVAWGVMRRPGVRRTERNVWLDPYGQVVSRVVQS